MMRHWQAIAFEEAMNCVNPTANQPHFAFFLPNH
jgi:hypothetical protein